jgi:hypothetical protein
MKRWQDILALAMVASATAHGVAAAAELVVVEARGVALHPGQVIDDTEPLVLREGQRVTLITANGNTLKLHGPYDQSPADGGVGGNNLAQAFAALVVQKQIRTSDVGVVRAGTGEAKLPEPWLIDVTRPGSRCVREGDRVVFWRPDAVPSVNVTVSPLDRSWRLSTTWPSGAERLTMPQDLPMQVRTTFLVDLGQSQVAVTLNTIPGAARTDPMRAAWMIEKGCQAQAEALLQALR